MKVNKKWIAFRALEYCPAVSCSTAVFFAQLSFFIQHYSHLCLRLRPPWPLSLHMKMTLLSVSPYLPSLSQTLPIFLSPRLSPLCVLYPPPLYLIKATDLITLLPVISTSFLWFNQHLNWYWETRFKNCSQRSSISLSKAKKCWKNFSQHVTPKFSPLFFNQMYGTISLHWGFRPWLTMTP